MFKKIVASLLLMMVISSQYGMAPKEIDGKDITYRGKLSWATSDILQAIEDDGVISDNHIAIIACFTASRETQTASLRPRPLVLWPDTDKQLILFKLCDLLKVSTDDKDSYIELLTEPTQLIKVPMHDYSVELKDTKISDTIINLYYQLHLKRWSSIHKLHVYEHNTWKKLPIVKHYPYWIPAHLNRLPFIKYVSTDDATSTDSSNDKIPLPF